MELRKSLRLLLLLLLVSLACRFSASDSMPAPDTPTQASPTLIVSPLPTTVVYKTIAGVDPDLLSLDIHAPANAANALLESGQVTGNVVLVAPDLDA